jgi:hypothetical protein
MKNNRNSGRKIAALCVLAMGATLYSLNEETDAPSIGRWIPKAVSGLWEREVDKAAAASLYSLPAPAAQRELRRHFLGLRLDEAGEASTDLSVLSAGLESEDEELRAASALFAESLIIDVAHGKVALHPGNQEAFSSLVAIYKRRAPEQIEKMRRAFPESPALAYLQTK